MTLQIHGTGRNLVLLLSLYMIIEGNSRAGSFQLFLLCSMMSRADMNDVYAQYARPGGWNG